MHTFRDNTGREWHIVIDVDSIKRVRSLIDVDLAKLFTGTPSILSRLTGMEDGSIDVILICDVLYALCKPQADVAGVSDEAFGQALGGKGLQEGQSMLLEELRDFFLALGRPDTAKAIEKGQALIAAAIRSAEKGLDQIDPEAEILQRLIHGSSSTSPPESSASTPALSPSGS